MEDMHHHGHGHDHDHHDHGEQNIGIAFILNLLFTIIEIVGGLWTNSVAILSDALHDFGDSLSLGLAWYFQRLSHKGRDQNYSYGYKRFSLLGALINALILSVGCVYIIIEAVSRLNHPEPTNAFGMIWLAVLGVIVNGAAVLQLKKGVSINEEIISLHLLEDVLGWVAVLIGALIMYFFDVPVIDPILSLGIAIFILYNAFKGLRKTINIILQGIPDKEKYNEVQSFLVYQSDIKDVHDLHIWSLDGRYNILTAHLVIDDDIKLEQRSLLKNNLRKELQELGIDHATIEFESESYQCSLRDC